MEKSLGVVDLTKTVTFAVQDKSILTVDMEELSRRNAERRAKADAAEATSKPAEDDWRGELSELERKFRIWQLPNGAITSLESLKELADREAAKHKAIVTKIQDELSYVRSLLKLEGLGRCLPLRKGTKPVDGDQCDTCVFTRKIASLESDLVTAERNQQISIKRHGAMVRDRKAIEPLLPRYKELSERASKIDTARKVARGMVAGDGGDLREMPVSIGDRYRASQVSGEADFDLGTPAK